MRATSQDRHTVVAQGRAAMHTPAVVVDRLGWVPGEPMCNAVVESQPLGFVAKHLAFVFSNASAFVVQRLPVGGFPSIQAIAGHCNASGQMGDYLFFVGEQGFRLRLAASWAAYH